MNTNIWNECDGLKHLTSLETTAWRMVEAQHIFSMRKLVDSSEEYALLEELVENSTPKTFHTDFPKLHPLLYTPFRHPSLINGSRFGNKKDRSLWYGSLQFPTVLAEKAYYQFLFLRASMVEFGNVLRTFTAFSTKIKTEISINLSKPPFDKYIQDISCPKQYKVSQSLGQAMRNDGVEAILYPSARTKEPGLNIALFTPKAFLHKKPESGSFQTWETLTNQTAMEFMRTSAVKSEYKIFRAGSFLVEGE